MHEHVLTAQAYEAQGDYAAKLKGRVEQMQEHVEDAADRADAAERHAEAILNRQDEEAIELDRQNKELNWNNQKLLRKASTSFLCKEHANMLGHELNKLNIVPVFRLQSWSSGWRIGRSHQGLKKKIKPHKWPHCQLVLNYYT